MNPASKLQYGDRFGDDVKKIARSALSIASVSSDAQVASTRYARWFHGEAGGPEPMATSAKKFRRITADMAIAEVIAATKENLSIFGGDASDLFASKLPTGHRMRKAIRSSILPNVPHLGTCKFGEIRHGSQLGCLRSHADIHRELRRRSRHRRRSCEPLQAPQPGFRPDVLRSPSHS